MDTLKRHWDENIKYKYRQRDMISWFLLCPPSQLNTNIYFFLSCVMNILTFNLVLQPCSYFWVIWSSFVMILYETHSESNNQSLGTLRELCSAHHRPLLHQPTMISQHSSHEGVTLKHLTHGQTAIYVLSEATLSELWAHVQVISHVKYCNLVNCWMKNCRQHSTMIRQT